MLFPHEKIRDTQDLMIKEVSEALTKGGNLIAHAPTGLGKTAAVLSPAVEYALEKGFSVFFLTSKNTQHRIAVETLKLIKSRNKENISVVDFIGKRWMCLHNFPASNMPSQFWNYCKEVRKKGECEFYTNLKGINRKLLLGRLEKERALHVEQFCSLCSEYKICPFEVACELAKKADVIIADYFHLLSPSIGKIFFEKIKKELSKSIVIIDESHNLPDRIRDLQSSMVSTLVIDRASNEAKILGVELNVIVTGWLCKLRDVLEEFSKDSGVDGEVLVAKQDFLKALFDSSETMSEMRNLIDAFRSAEEFVVEEKKQSFIGLVADFIKAWNGEDFGFTRILSKKIMRNGKENISLTYRCLDPAIIMKKLVEESRSVILMSGTLTPTQMYRDLLGFDKEARLVEYESPFPKENSMHLIVSGVTTKFTARGEDMLRRIAEYCARIVNAVNGNTIIFLPSYMLRDKINRYFEALCEKSIFFEEQGMEKGERDELLGKFKEYKDSGAVLLAVSAGSFGEGIDLAGDYLRCVIVVGIPLSKPNLEIKELINYYQERFGRGWEYGYIYPAIIKCMQNAGRCIRSETDRGVVMFMDERYKWGNYRKCFPGDWNMNVVDINKAEDKLKGFFGV